MLVFMRVCEQTCTHLHIELQTSRQQNIQKVSTAKVIISINDPVCECLSICITHTLLTNVFTQSHCEDFFMFYGDEE